VIKDIEELVIEQTAADDNSETEAVIGVGEQHDKGNSY